MYGTDFEDIFGEGENLDKALFEDEFKISLDLLIRKGYFPNRLIPNVYILLFAG